MSCQTGEDSTAREAQTDGITTMDRWVQWPPEDLKGWGCDNKDDDDDITTSNDVTNNLLSDKDAMGLTRFLQSASQVSQVNPPNESLNLDSLLGKTPVYYTTIVKRMCRTYVKWHKLM